MTTMIGKWIPLVVAAAAILAMTPGRADAAYASRLVRGGPCGWAGSGRVVSIHNTRRDTGVVATVRESYVSGQTRWSRTLSFSLQPGEQRHVGCTTHAASQPGDYDHSIVGERLTGGPSGPSRPSGPGSVLVMGDACGWAGSGRTVTIRSTRRDMIVTATVRESYTSGATRWTRTLTFTLEPGAERRIGCTIDQTSQRGQYVHSIVGERLGR